MPSSTPSNALSARPAPIWSAPSAAPAAPLTCLSATGENSTSCSITRHVWVVQHHRSGWWLDENGLLTDRLEWAWRLLDPHVAAARVRQLGFDPYAYRLVPMTLTAHPSIPWQWHANS